jgi:hypothetical protein
MSDPEKRNSLIMFIKQTLEKISNRILVMKSTRFLKILELSSEIEKTIFDPEIKKVYQKAHGKLMR